MDESDSLAGFGAFFLSLNSPKGELPLVGDHEATLRLSFIRVKPRFSAQNGNVLNNETGMAPALSLLQTTRMRLNMKAFVYAQFHPVKTMRQFINDRGLYRALILAMLVMNWCF